jgi:hypothetical protein
MDGNNTIPMNMPVMPAGFGNYGGGFGDFGGNGWWVILLFLFAGGFGNGFGGFGNGGGFMNADIQRGFDQSAVMTGVQGIQNTLTSGFGDLQTALCGGFAGVNANISNGFAQAEIGENARQMANMNRSFDAQVATMQGFNGLQGQLSQCCCDNRLATVQTQNIVQNEGANTRLAIQAQTQAILDKMCQDDIDRKNEKILELQNSLNMANLTASQVAQTATILAALTTTTPTAPAA